jgi:hypothetical protein
MSLNQQQQIESYLAGQMSPEDASLFEAQLEVNPELRQELKFQTEVIRGISEYRKIQLKSRLDAVNVSAGWWSTMQYSTLGQFIGGAMLVGLIGGGIYWWADKWSLDESSNVTETEVPALISDNEADLTLTPEVEKESVNEGRFINENTKTSETSEAKKESETSEKSEEQPVKKFIPKVKVPSAGNVDEEKAFNPEELPVPAESTSTTEKSAPVEVEVIDTKSTRIKYRYYAGKLFLYGNFSSEPYEILEINTSKGRNIYLYHLKSYYEITPSDKPVGVQQITDAQLIQELSILRKAK